MCGIDHKCTTRADTRSEYKGSICSGNVASLSSKQVDRTRGNVTHRASVTAIEHGLVVSSSASSRKVGDCVEKVIRNQFVVILQHDRASQNTKCAMTVPTAANLQLSGSTVQEKYEAWVELRKQVDYSFESQTYVIEGIPPKIADLP